MCSLRKGNKTEFLRQPVRGEKQLTIRLDQTAKWLANELCGELNCKLAKSNYVIDVPNFTLTLSPVICSFYFHKTSKVMGGSRSGGEG